MSHPELCIVCGRSAPAVAVSAQARRHCLRPINLDNTPLSSRPRRASYHLAGAPPANGCVAAANACHPHAPRLDCSPIRVARCLAPSTPDDGCAWPPGPAEEDQLSPPCVDRSGDIIESSVSTCGTNSASDRLEARDVTRTRRPAVWSHLPCIILVDHQTQPAVSFRFIEDAKHQSTA